MRVLTCTARWCNLAMKWFEGRKLKSPSFRETRLHTTHITQMPSFVFFADWEHGSDLRLRPAFMAFRDFSTLKKNVSPDRPRPLPQLETFSVRFTVLWSVVRGDCRFPYSIIDPPPFPRRGGEALLWAMLRRRAAGGAGHVSHLSGRFFYVILTQRKRSRATFLVLANSGENACRHAETTVGKSDLPKISDVLKQ